LINSQYFQSFSNKYRTKQEKNQVKFDDNIILKCVSVRNKIPWYWKSNTFSTKSPFQINMY